MKTRSIPAVLYLVFLGFFLLSCGGTTSEGPIEPGTPQIGISSDTLDFGANGLERSLIIYNTGGGTLNWAFMSWPFWIDPSVSSGSLTASSSQSVVFNLDRTPLNPGNNQGEIIVSSSTDSLIITVLAEVLSGPVLGEPPDTLNFGAAYDSLALTITNTGLDTLNWNIALNSTYFNASPDSGTTESQSTVWVHFDRQNAPTGTLSALLTVNSNGGSAQVYLQAYSGSLEGQWLSFSGESEGYYQAYPSDYFFMVRFDRPEGWQDFKISSIRLQLHTLSGAYDDIQLLCWGTVISNGYLFPDISQTLHESAALDPGSGWNEWAVNWNLALSTFCVGYYQYDYSPDIYPDLYYDLSSPAARSYYVWQQTNGNYVVDLLSDREWCMEIFVEPVYTLGGGATSPGRWLQPTKISPEQAISAERPLPLARMTSGAPRN